MTGRGEQGWGGGSRYGKILDKPDWTDKHYRGRRGGLEGQIL